MQNDYDHNLRLELYPCSKHYGTPRSHNARKYRINLSTESAYWRRSSRYLSLPLNKELNLNSGFRTVFATDPW